LIFRKKESYEEYVLKFANEETTKKSLNGFLIILYILGSIAILGISSIIKQ
jgi:hypothetical protein